MAGQSFPLPTVLTYPSTTPPTLITQGAEGRVYKTTYLLPSLPCALKHRPPKPYRHPVLDARLTRQRILAEARVLAKCRREGVSVPALYAADESSGWLAMEWVDGRPVRAAVNEWLGDRTTAAEAEAAAGRRDTRELVALMRRVGVVVGRLHATGIVHGDLTTSNMMLRPRSRDRGSSRTNGTASSTPNGGRHGDGDGDGDAEGILDGEIVVIDFGLASQSQSEEDRAVDLYVLERAFGSTHPRAEHLFPELLEGYKEAFKGAKPVLRKLEDVRLRGRKRSMLG